MLVKFACKGSLLHHLQKCRKTSSAKWSTISNKDKLKFARDVASGMFHLSKNQCIHRDLAARNILLGEDNVAMVSDFGLSRDVYESGQYETTTGGLLPIRWMALESLDDFKYTSQSDVWSFGVFLWEIESGGKTPYSGLSGMEVVEFIRSGSRLPQPAGCSEMMYQTMKECWRTNPADRPKFDELFQRLSALVVASEEMEAGKDVSPLITSEKCDTKL